MTTMKMNKGCITPNHRNASNPFKIYFTGKPYYLTAEHLMEQGYAPIADKRRWTCPHIKFIAYKSCILELEVSTLERPAYCLTIEIEPDSLQICCNCGMVVEKLCVHALMALERIVGYEYKGAWYFERYRPDGKVETGQRHTEFFKKEINGPYCHFSPKTYSGSIYAFSNENNLAAFNHIKALPGTPDLNSLQDNTVITYQVMQARNSRLRMPPFLIPCLGVLKRDGESIKSFDRFQSGMDKEYTDHLTANEIFLNDLCHKMWDYSKNTNPSLLKTDNADRGKLEKLFQLWDQAVPCLHQQDYVYFQPLYYIRDLKGRPMKKLARRMSIGKVRPKLCFQLADKGAYYRLDLHVYIGGKKIALINVNMGFFIHYKGIDYLVASILDAAVLEWMKPMDNSLVIFKEHFEQFEAQYLDFLKQNYPVLVKEK